nr:hypothetical protein [uncultured Rhodopila sp.]
MMSLTHRIVLLVEDEVAVRGITSEWLRDLGYHMLEAEDGPTALDVLTRTDHLDLLVTDVGCKRRPMTAYRIGSA